MKMILDERGKKYILKEGQDFQSDLGIVSAEVLSDAEIGDEVKRIYERLESMDLVD